MKAEYRQAVQEFLRQSPPQALGKPVMHGKDTITKAAVIPFYPGNPPLFYVMKPVAKKPNLPPPNLQICKGTRMVRIGMQWQDMRSHALLGDEYELLEETALREGIEEVGLRLSNVSALYELGRADFTSASSGRRKEMWVYLAKVVNKDDFDLPDPAYSATESCEWVSAEEFRKIGRLDHRGLLDKVSSNLAGIVR